MKKITITALVAFTAFFMNSCDDISELNNDTKAFTKPVPEALMSSAQKEYARFFTNSNVGLNNFRMFSQQWTHIEYTQEANYNMNNRPISNSIYSNLYKDVLKNLTESKTLIEAQTVLTPNETIVKQNKIAIIEIQIVSAYQTLVDLFGNVPYTEALNYTNLSPKYDDAKTIYLDLAKRLDIALGTLNTTKASFGKADLIYEGNVTNWKKLGNSIKLRLGLHLADTDNAKAKEMVESAYASGLISSESDNAVFKYLAIDPNSNPLFGDINGGFQYTPTQFLVDELNRQNDPRRDAYFDPTSKIGGVYVGAPYGLKGIWDDVSHLTQTFYNREYPGILFDYSETSFLLADAANRGYNVGGITAATYYQQGIRASMKQWDIPTADVDTYLAQPSVDFATATGSNAKERIAYQLWIAYYNRGFEAWTEYRRLDFPILVAPSTAVSEAGGKVPVRITYSHLDKLQNFTNYTAASTAIGGDKLTTKIFWDKY